MEEEKEAKEDTKLSEVISKVKEDLGEIITQKKEEDPQNQLEFQKMFKYELKSGPEKYKYIWR